ncbi:MAG TPA: hypothetical protein VMD53_17995 [Rhizomicrobium sp.]|nr:hypothetical protein [Rhizomicrobium sp.]
MVESGSAKRMFRGSRSVKALAVMTIAACALLAPVKSYAETDEAIVMVCKWDRNPALVQTLTLDMAKKAAVIEQNSPNSFVYPQGTVTEISDQQVIFVLPTNVNDPTDTMTVTLNRYTGHLSEVSSIPSPEGITITEYTCQKQQKQF